VILRYTADARREVVEARVEQLLRRHDSVISRREALAAGLTDGGIRSRLADRRWRTASPGVYVVAGTSPTPQRRLRLAITAAGPDAAASHRSAAWLWGLLDRPPTRPTVTVPANRRPRLPDVDLHRSHLPFDSHERRGLPCTGAARTLIDCATVLPPPALADLVDRALASRAMTVDRLAADLDDGRFRKLPGRVALRRCLEQRGMVGGPTPSVLESRTARLLRRHHLPIPRAEVVWGDQGQYRLDFAYPTIRLVVEVDGYAWHASPEQFARDHQRRNELVAAGWTLLTYGWRDVDGASARVAAEIARVHRELSSAAVSPRRR
jgi:very-short-patch-repair endonuclease